LPDLGGLLKLASRPEWLRVSLKQGAQRQIGVAAPKAHATGAQARASHTPQQKVFVHGELHRTCAQACHSADFDCDLPSFD
jgi:DUF971 family protein